MSANTCKKSFAFRMESVGPVRCSAVKGREGLARPGVVEELDVASRPGAPRQHGTVLASTLLSPRLFDRGPSARHP